MVPSPRITSYQYYFSKVLTKRLRYVHKINALFSVLLSLLLSLFYGSFWSNLLRTLYRAPILYTALWTVKLCRDFNSTVEYSRAKTLALHVVHAVASRRFAITWSMFCVSAYVIFLVFLTQIPLMSQYYVVAKEYRHRPAINDEWVYFWFHAYFIALVYSVQHLVFQRQRLRFKYGVSSVRPEVVLFTGFGSLFGNSVAFTVICSFAAPIIYYIARSIIYKVNWLFFAMLSLDTSIPDFHIRFLTLFHVGWVSFWVFFSWELVNHIYNVYASIGCLDGKKTISSHSKDPIATLLSGLRDIEPQNQLSRLAAFQELAYLANTSDAEGIATRNAVYNVHARGNYVWPAILDECGLVIRNVSSRVNYRLKTDMAALKSIPLEKNENATEKRIFGNSHDISEGFEADITTSSPVKKYSEPANNKKQPWWAEQWTRVVKSLVGQWVKSHVWKISQDWFVAFVTPGASQPKSFAAQLEILKKKATVYQEKFLSSSFGVFFRITVKRDAESRVVNPVNFGNAVIALTGLLMHAVEEDRHGTISNNHISEVFNLLERPIRACANYTDILPASVYKELQENQKHHLVALLHDLTMNEFFQLCVKYNFKLNDLLLSSRAFKLAKWVIDASIAQQQKHKPEAKIY